MNKRQRGGMERIITTVIIVGLVVTVVIAAIVEISASGTGLTQGVMETLPAGDPKIRVTN